MEKALVPTNDRPDIADRPEEHGVVELSPRDVLRRASEMARALVDVVSRARGLEVTISGRKYLRVEAWMTIAAFHNTSVIIDFVRKEDDDSFVARASVVSRDGRVVSSAEASCSRDEPSWRDRPDYMLRSMAQTRAAAKALRVAYAYVPVLAGYEATPAEEVDGEAPDDVEVEEVKPTTNPPPTPPQRSHGLGFVGRRPRALSAFLFALREAGWPEKDAKLVWQVIWPEVERWRDLTPYQQELVSEVAPFLIRLVSRYGLEPARKLLQPLPLDLMDASAIKKAISEILSKDV